MDNLNTVKVIWLGQGGFLFEFDQVRVVVDPYLSNSLAKRGIERLVEIPIAIKDLHPDYVLFTHDHADHFDKETVVELTKCYPNCEFIGPTSVAEHYERLGFNLAQFQTLNKAETYYGTTFSVNAVPAFHTDLYSVGFVFSYYEHQIYISGDTLLDNELIPLLKKEIKEGLSLVMICINGKLGNMTDKEAIEIVKVFQPKTTVPMHYGMFESNTIDPEFFHQSLNELGHQCELMKPGIVKIFNL